MVECARGFIVKQGGIDITLDRGRNISELEPVASVGDPPTEVAGGDSCGEGPPERESKIGEYPKRGEGRPENFLLHDSSLGVHDSVATSESRNFHPRYTQDASRIREQGGLRCRDS